ncbi:MAG: zinc-ribbon domain-containing protein, partial [Clostridiales bacterium]|nr:zinc-ribbon domain-containing protein [Clostridiales bacterium]
MKIQKKKEAVRLAKYCVKCGTLLEDEARNCPECGAKAGK